MTTVQLTQRLARHLVVADSAQLDGEVLLDVLASINAGLSAFYRELPSIYRQTTISATLRAPVAQAVTFDDKYRNTLLADTFTVAQRGCTLRINGQSDNEITGTGTVLDDYLGDDLLSIPSTIYSDAVQLRSPIKRLTSEVRIFYPGTQVKGIVLVPAQRNRIFGWWLPGLGGGRYGYGWTDSGSVGRPTHYYIDPVGASGTDGSLYFLLRVFPKPDRDYILRFEAELGAQQLTLADLQNAVEVPVAHDWAEDILVPLCEAELASSKWWRDPKMAQMAIEKRPEVIAQRLGKTPAVMTVSRNNVGTPNGY